MDNVIDLDQRRQDRARTAVEVEIEFDVWDPDHGWIWIIGDNREAVMKQMTGCLAELECFGPGSGISFHGPFVRNDGRYIAGGERWIRP